MTGGEALYLALCAGAVLVMLVALIVQGVPHIKEDKPD